jgi:hypothetical protein
LVILGPRTSTSAPGDAALAGYSQVRVVGPVRPGSNLPISDQFLLICLDYHVLQENIGAQPFRLAPLEPGQLSRIPESVQASGDAALAWIQVSRRHF